VHRQLKANESRLTSGEAASDESDGSPRDSAPPIASEHPDQKKAAKPTPVTATFIPTSAETLMGNVVSKYLTSIVDERTVSLGDIRDALLYRINAEFALENMGRKGAYSPSPPIFKVTVLDELTVVKVLLARQRIVAIDLSDGEADEMTLLAMYVDFGDDEGTYTASESRIKALASDLKPSMTSNAIDSLYKRLRIHAPIVFRTNEPHLIPVGNGVFDHSRQTLRPFSSTWVFLSKLPIPYDQNAMSPVIVMPDGVEWDVESWVQSLSDDEGVPELLWEIVSAAVRSQVSWDKAIWFTAEKGNNGKGTLVELLRNLLGSRACSSVKFADFGHEFKMEPLILARVNLVDENDVGDFYSKIAEWKAAITGDVFPINRKNRTPVRIRFNSMTPRTKDKSGSFYRRLLFVPFNKWFGDSERKYIKKDYLKRPEVLQYVLKRALVMTHTELSNPKVCEKALDDYKGNNNMLLSFWNEFEPQLKWGLVPFRFLFDLYREWFRKTNPSGQPESLNSLVSFLREHLAGSPKWEHKGSTDVRPKGLMDAPETLIADYGLEDWMNESYGGTDSLKKSVVSPLRVNYKGLVRL
jgi:putative DNA primase/helicase